jgi:hypothetical protein
MKKRNRTPAHRVNRKQRALAIRALTAIVSSPDAAEYVKAKAAAALLNNCKDADADAILQDDDRPWTVVILPDKGNDPGVRYGQYEERQSVIIVPSGFPSEVQPESYYKDVPKPAPDPRIAMRNRAETLRLSGPDEDEAA